MARVSVVQNVDSAMHWITPYPAISSSYHVKPIETSFCIVENKLTSWMAFFDASYHIRDLENFNHNSLASRK